MTMIAAENICPRCNRETTAFSKLTGKPMFFGVKRYDPNIDDLVCQKCYRGLASAYSKKNPNRGHRADPMNITDAQLAARIMLVKSKEKELGRQLHTEELKCLLETHGANA